MGVMEGLTTRQVLVSVLIYTLATVPWLLLLVVTATKKCESWVLRTTTICAVICGVGWEVWYNYGVWGGDPVDQRRPEPLNTIMPKHINWMLNSLDDGAICMGAIGLIYLVRKEGLRQFSWSALAIVFIWFLFQNILVEMIIYRTQVAKGKELSWAPLTPLGPWVNPTLFTIGTATCTLQTQLPWVIMTPVFYLVLLREQARFKQNQRFV